MLRLAGYTHCTPHSSVSDKLLFIIVLSLPKPLHLIPILFRKLYLYQLFVLGMCSPPLSLKSFIPNHYLIFHQMIIEHNLILLHINVFPTFSLFMECSDQFAAGLLNMTTSSANARLLRYLPSILIPMLTQSYLLKDQTLMFT